MAQVREERKREGRGSQETARRPPASCLWQVALCNRCNAMVAEPTAVLFGPVGWGLVRMQYLYASFALPAGGCHPLNSTQVMMLSAIGSNQFSSLHFTAPRMPTCQFHAVSTTLHTSTCMPAAAMQAIQALCCSESLSVGPLTSTMRASFCGDSLHSRRSGKPPGMQRGVNEI